MSGPAAGEVGAGQEALLPEPAAARMRHIPELDGIRGIAALAVFFHHVCFTSVHIDAQPGWPRSIVALFHLAAFGERGVDLFFALSGYLITSILLGERRSTRYYQDFYWKRALRVLPLYVVSLLGVLIFLHQVAYVALAAVFVVNFASVLHVQGFGPFWTLSIEEQFYLLWPTVVRRKTVTGVRAWALGVAASAVILRYLFALRGHHNYYLTFLHCDGLAFGAVLACHFHLAGDNPRLRRAWDLALAAILAVGLLIGFWPTLDTAQALDHATEQTGVTMMAGACIGLAISRTGAAFLAPLRSRVLLFFGLISYALYLVHTFVLVAYDRLRGALPARDVRGYWLRFAAILGGTIAACLLTRYAIELPALKLRRFVLKHPSSNAEHAHPPLPLANQ